MDTPIIAKSKIGNKAAAPKKNSVQFSEFYCKNLFAENKTVKFGFLVVSWRLFGGINNKKRGSCSFIFLKHASKICGDFLHFELE